MEIKDLVEVDFVNYKKPTMHIAFPYCSFKCERECGKACCQNSVLAKAPSISVPVERIIELYKANEIVHGIVLAGLEPLDSFGDVIELISAFREKFNDDIVIYTGYTEDEAATYVEGLKKFTNIIVKFGRFIPNSESRFDEVLGVTLASKNQVARKIS